jgi:hypothetical protein
LKAKKSISEVVTSERDSLSPKWQSGAKKKRIE